MRMNKVLLKYKNINCFTESVPFFPFKNSINNSLLRYKSLFFK